MKISMLIWTCSKNASDGSYIPENVWAEYIRSDRSKEALEDGSMLCTLTHRSRSLDSLPEGQGKLKSVIGKDDGVLIVTDNNPAPVMKISRLWMEGDKVYAEAEVFDEGLFDPAMANQIRRFKGLLRSGVKLGCSCVLVCYWEPDGSGHDIGKKIQRLKAVDVTVNPSCPDSKILGILEDGDEAYEDTFSERDSRTLKANGVVCKTFSDSMAASVTTGLPRTSKIGLRVCELKVKQFSQVTDIRVTPEEATQKEYSIGAVRERVRLGKMSPRLQFRRLMIDYKGALKAAGGQERMKPEEVKVLKSLFVNDVLMIVKQIYPDIMKGKQIATLLGASSISKGTREAAQKLQLPFRMAMMQFERTGYISKDRLQKIQDAYLVFTDSLVNEIFDSNVKIEETPEDEETSE
nr:MAG TPA: Prohead core protein serine protease [Caudoviricetes sp.]